MRSLVLGLCVLALGCGGCGGRATLEDAGAGSASGGFSASPAAGAGRASTDAGAIPPSQQAPVARGVDVVVYNDEDAPAPKRETPPTTCDDVGTFAGTSSCCEEQLCIGTCSRGTCACGTAMPGCPWPLVCCGGGKTGGICAGPDSPSCRSPGKGNNEKDVRPLVIEDADCGTANIPHGEYSRMCCNGAVCEGRCTLNPALGKGVCDCNYAVGGCPAPLECCWPGGCVPKGRCREAW